MSISDFISVWWPVLLLTMLGQFFFTTLAGRTSWAQASVLAFESALVWVVVNAIGGQELASAALMAIAIGTFASIAISIVWPRFRRHPPIETLIAPTRVFDPPINPTFR